MQSDRFGKPAVKCNQANNHFVFVSSTVSPLSSSKLFLIYSSVMADLYIKELEAKVDRYETIMSRCPQCMVTLSIQGAESIESSSHESRSSPSAQQVAAKTPQPIFTGPSQEPAPASTLRPFARFAKPPHPASRTEPHASSPKQPPPSVQQGGPVTRSNKATEPPVPTPPQPSITSSDRLTTNSVTDSAADPPEQPTTSAPTPSTHPSSLGLDTAEGRNQHSGKLLGLDLQQRRPRNKGGRPPGESPKREQWMGTANRMLEEVPSGRHWLKKVTTMDNSIIAAVAMGDAPVPQRVVSPTEDVERKELIRLVRRFAERHSEARLNFEHFVLVCLCKVLSRQGVSKTKIVETLQICISDTGSKNIDRYLHGAVWANTLINELFFTDWGYRAVDLIAICNVLRELC